MGPRDGLLSFQRRKHRKVLLLVLAMVLTIMAVFKIPSVQFQVLKVEHWSYVNPSPKEELWKDPYSGKFEQCIERRENHVPPQEATNGYIQVNANGGLNQMRAGICDMVAVARLMNATLVVPSLDRSSYWGDPSQFGDIFDVDHFIEMLKQDVKIVKTLPSSHKNLVPFVMAPVSWSNETYYQNQILPIVKKHQVVHFDHADSRLANNYVSDEIQQLRCRANYQALKYTERIEKLGQILVERMRAKGPYLALHLRYEKDMLSFTGCTHGLTAEEAKATEELRYSIGHWKVKEIDGEAKRLEGNCPMTPHEMALMLKALGFPKSTNIYLVAGQIFGKYSMASLLEEYPNVYTHDSLATEEELAPLHGYQNRLAAVDYIVAVGSDTFVYSYDGNMAKAVEGHRRFNGHRLTIKPDRKSLVRLFDYYEAGFVSWEQCETKVRRLQQDRIGAPSYRQPGDNPKKEENFYANSLPGCICNKEEL